MQQRRLWDGANPSRRSVLVFLVLVAGLAFGWLAGATTSGRAAEALQRLEITSANGGHTFQIELARTPPEREKGLMYRRYMPKDRGMLFDFGSPESAAMWMENTYLPLDMLFIRQDGSIARIETHTEPLSRRVIASGEPVLGVLELNSGICDELGIKAGDKVSHPMFKPH
ncbi:hypothetical protein SAMN05444161_2479 [Rhizobiales bacterium GAS191]|nr:hypothetical protein SAMN05519103_01593 [Rhizobiales bacterium GAS113]SEC14308.1 hypothetical protein SAMN05519104_0835 [Rhizobiales bacterium GAS188]SED08617.1 hypothetical protein SAMN05444161_2479 [Rhizobiales bacterium GAS191]